MLLKNFCLLLGTFVFLFFTAEFICRLFPFGAFVGKMNVAPVYHVINDQIYSMTPQCNKPRVSDKRAINCQGYRSYQDFVREKKKFRIALLGDSYAQDTGVKNEEETFYFQLEAELNKNLSDKLEVYNFGMGGFNTQQEFYMLKDVALDYDPDMIFLQYFGNDTSNIRIVLNGRFLVPKEAHTITYSDNPIPLSLSFSPDIDFFLITHSEAYKRLLVLLDKAGIGKSREKEPYFVGMERIRHYMKEIAKIAKARKIPLVIVNFPGAAPNDTVCSQEYLDRTWLPLLDEELRRDAIIGDLCEVQRLHKGEELRAAGDSLEIAHYNEAGNKIAAKYVADLIMKSGLMEQIRKQLVLSSK